MRAAEVLFCDYPQKFSDVTAFAKHYSPTLIFFGKRFVFGRLLLAFLDEDADADHNDDCDNRDNDSCIHSLCSFLTPATHEHVRKRCKQCRVDPES
jgi:hypothetical protein